MAFYPCGGGELFPRLTYRAFSPAETEEAVRSLAETVKETKS